MAEKKTKKEAAAKAIDAKSLGAADLKTELAKARAERAKLAFTHQTAPLKDPMQLRRLRRDIARMETFLRQKEAVK